MRSDLLTCWSITPSELHTGALISTTSTLQARDFNYHFVPRDYESFLDGATPPPQVGSWGRIRVNLKNARWNERAPYLIDSRIQFRPFVLERGGWAPPATHLVISALCRGSRSHAQPSACSSSDCYRALSLLLAAHNAEKIIVMNEMLAQASTHLAPSRIPPVL